MVEVRPHHNTSTGASTINPEPRKKDSTFGILLKFYKILFTKCHQKKNEDRKSPENDLHHKGIEKTPEPEEETAHGAQSFRYDADETPPECPGCFFKPWSTDTGFRFKTSSISRSASRRRSPSPTRSFTFRSRSSNRSHPARSLSRNASRRSSNSPIMYSNSLGVMKLPPVERNLECTLEELCFGCTKKIMITRDAITNSGQIVQEEELLSINVKPGWKKGTKITFEGMGNEVLRGQPDIIFVIAEKPHHLFSRYGADDLELVVQIPLVNALTGCRISVPLLGGDEMQLSMDGDEIIHPGHEMIIEEQGMPTKKNGKRGNLKLIFMVEFPNELTDEQRSNAFTILEDCC